MSRFALIWERTYPFTFGLAAMVGWLLLGHEFADYCGRNQWAFDKIFESLFGFSSISTGFLAGFYGTIQSITEGFIQEIRRSVTFETFIKYTKHGVICGFVFAIYTIPFMVVQPLPIDQLSAGNFFVASWVAVATTTMAMFFRVAQHLFSLFETRVRQRRPGG